MKQLTTIDRPGLLLDQPDRLSDTDTGSLLGFGGLHGGLTLGMLAATLQQAGARRSMRYATGQFLRPATGALDIAVDTGRTGRATTRGEATLLSDGSVAAKASVVFAMDPSGSDRNTFAAPNVAPAMPEVDPPERCTPFSIPEEFVPFSRHVEIRPADDNRPFTGGTDPSLTAWIRLVEDDRAPDGPRLITLLDALAPSYAAVLDELLPIPTLELGVRLTGLHDRDDADDSPWVLLRAVTRSSVDGWVDERLDAWSPAGIHLAGATQVRLVLHS